MKRELFLGGASCALMVMLLAGCGGGGGSNAPKNPEDNTSNSVAYSPAIPKGFPQIKQAADNPLSEAKVKLGRHLFYDNRISSGNNTSCGTCHQSAKGFTDGLAVSVGTTGEVGIRSAMGLTNVIYNSAFNWVNPLLTTPHQQALNPMFGEAPVELGWAGNDALILGRLKAAADVNYVNLFADAYPKESEPFNADNVAKAIGAFVSTMISGNSAYDKEVYQGTFALSAAARRGMDLFNSERLECFHCHGGFNFTASVNHAGTVFDQTEFFNNGLYNIGGVGNYPVDNMGLWIFTGIAEDMGKFRVPTLRNIELSAPYMHDGSIASLEEVLAHYSRGGRLIASGPYAGDGALNPYKDGQIVGFVLSESEKADVIEFFKSLTDWEFICRSDLQDPFGNFAPHPNCP